MADTVGAVVRTREETGRPRRTAPNGWSRPGLGRAKRRPLDPGVHVQRVQVDDFVVTNPALVLAHAHTAARHDPETAALLGYRANTALTFQAAAALLCALHTTDALTGMGLRAARHTTRINAAFPHRESIVLELTDAPKQDG